MNDKKHKAPGQLVYTPPAQIRRPWSHFSAASTLSAAGLPIVPGPRSSVAP